MAEFQTNECGTICLCLLNLLAIRCLQLWSQPMGPLCLWQCFFTPSPCLTWARGKKHCHRNWGQGSCTPSLDSKGLLLPHLGLSGRLFPLHHLSSRRLKKFHIYCDKGVESTCYSTSVNQYIWVFGLKNKLVHRSDCPKFIVKGPVVTCSTLSTVALGGAVEVQAESGASGPTLKEQEVK